MCANFAYAGAFKDVIAKGAEGRAAHTIRLGGGGEEREAEFPSNCAGELPVGETVRGEAAAHTNEGL